ncbi:hypothetical protein [Dietzia natronolimnaea]|uniref:hypothetical protein n=1 Tax=Dietzia natronolimnaea TaxID=161920 RepID=UPI0015FD096F|nr:hypothetical protein [Dietzia natronolimnaea]MBB1036886.1 hypothetical protein [Dietzia natronolimnaea]
MKLDRTDVLVLVIGIASLGTALGSLFDIWHAVYYAVPLLTVAFMLMGSLSLDGAWHPANLTMIVAFCAVLAGLFVAAQFALGSGGMLGGLPVSTAIFVYMIWPLTAVGAPLVYAAVHKSWLMHDLTQDSPTLAS